MRIQLSRRKGWRMPPNTVSAARPGKLGNPFTMAGCRDAGFRGTDREIAARCVGAFDAWLTSIYWRTNWQGPESEAARAAILAGLPDLRGRNLACWCHLCDAHRDGKPFDVECPDCAPCHVDVLGPLANSDNQSSGAGACLTSRSGENQ